MQLNDRTSVVIAEKNSVIVEQMEKIRSMRAAAARRRVEVEQRRQAAMSLDNCLSTESPSESPLLNLSSMFSLKGDGV